MSCLLGPSLQILKECGRGQQCVQLTKCRNFCSKLESAGSGLSAMTLLMRSQFNSRVCGFIGHNPKICCEKSLTSQTDVCTLEKQSTPTTTTAIPTTTTTCGIVSYQSHIQRVTDGEEADPGKWPWMARLIYQKNREERNTTFCSGSLVSSRHVVTAAHCVLEEEYGQPVAVVLGELDITTEYDCLHTQDDCGADGEPGRKCLEAKLCADKSKQYQVLSTTVHEQYSADGGEAGFGPFPVFDIAILTLATPTKFSTYIQPVCLPDPARLGPNGSARPLVLTGWGNTVAGYEQPVSAVILQELIGLKEKKLEECRNDLGLPLREHQMCVWSESTARACDGDSGGPVARLHREPGQESGVWELVGVVSFGRSTICGASAPLVVTRVEDRGILNWIKIQVGNTDTTYP